jgi:hypothetical protein
MKPTMEKIRSLADFVSGNRWDLSFVTFPKGVSVATSEDINLRCVSSEIPKLTQSAGIAVKIRGHEKRQAGDFAYSDSITLTVVETIDSKVHEFIRQWREKTWETNTAKAEYQADLEAEILLSRLDQKDNIIWVYKLIGCHLTDYDVGSLSESGEALNATITLTYDYFKDGKTVA